MDTTSIMKINIMKGIFMQVVKQSSRDTFILDKDFLLFFILDCISCNTLSMRIPQNFKHKETM